MYLIHVSQRVKLQCATHESFLTLLPLRDALHRLRAYENAFRDFHKFTLELTVLGVSEVGFNHNNYTRMEEFAEFMRASVIENLPQTKEEFE